MACIIAMLLSWEASIMPCYLACQSTTPVSRSRIMADPHPVLPLEEELGRLLEEQRAVLAQLELCFGSLILLSLAVCFLSSP